MDILEVMERFPDQDACIKHLEKIRWGDGNVSCPHCDCTEVYRKNETQEDAGVGRAGRWICNSCNPVLKLPVAKYFMAQR